jgi:hypothetical protein
MIVDNGVAKDQSQTYGIRKSPLVFRSRLEEERVQEINF